MPFGIVMCPFSDNLSQNSRMHLHFIFATWNSHISWLNMLDTMLLILKLRNWIWKNTKFLDGIRDLAPTLLESKGWCTGESTCLPPMWSRFKSWCRCHMWVEVVVGSLLFSERFFSRYSGFPLSSKTNIFTCAISTPYLFIYLLTYLLEKRDWQKYWHGLGSCTVTEAQGVVLSWHPPAPCTPSTGTYQNWSLL